MSRLISQILLVTVAGAPKEVVPRTELAHPCHRSISRQVRKQVEKEILKPAERAGIKEWPAACPLAPARDLWAGQEKHKSRKRSTTGMWTCGYCQKVFKSEHYLDLHLERHHMDETPPGGVCLADYCEIFDACHPEVTRRGKSDPAPSCNNETMLLQRRRCEESLAKCLPLDQEESRKLHAKLSRHFCQMMDCRIRAERHKEQNHEMMPVVVLLILVVLLGFIAFSLTVCCVDYSDDFLNYLEESNIISSRCRRRATEMRENTRSVMHLDRTKTI